MENKRIPIPQKTRFEVFKRDRFTCQYCGRSAPDVILEIDHINPVSKGGSNDIMNLVTSCKECNRGKGARELSDDTVVKKQQEQIHELAEKNEQLEMMLKWREGLQDIQAKELDTLINYINEMSGKKYCVNENGSKKVKNWLKDYTLMELMDATDDAIDQYYLETQTSFEEAFHKIPTIAYYKKHPMTAEKRNVYYLRKILKNRLYYVNDALAFKYLKDAMDYGADFEDLKNICKHCKNWTEFREIIEGEYLCEE